MPRPKKQAVVVPTTSLVASAVNYSGKAARVYQGSKNWQREAYRHYGICGEARFAAQFYGHAMSRATLNVVKRGSDDFVPQDSGPGVDLLNRLFNGENGQSQMLNALGIHFTIAGECYLIGRTVDVTEEDQYTGDTVPTGDTEEIWEIVSILEVRNAGNRWWLINSEDGSKTVDLTDDDVVIRLWMPDPENRACADSPFKSLIPILTEIEWLTRHVFAQVQSRLAGAGLLVLPQGMSFPPPPPIDGVPQVLANDADAFMLSLADAMMRPLEDPSSPSALVPIVVTAPDDTVDKPNLMHFWSELDANSGAMRQEAIHRFALGMDIPPEQILGMSSNGGSGGGRSHGISHWGAWQIEEATIKMHIEPMLELVCNALTIGYLRPLNGPDEVIAYDTAALRLRPDRSREALELYNLGLLSAETVLRENGFDATDMPTPDEHKTWLLSRVAAGSATPEQVQAALELLGVTLPVTAPDPGLGDNMRDTRPPPSIEDHPTRDLPDPLPESNAAALLAASEGLVFRALERCGNRIRQTTGVKPPGIPSFEVHTLHPVNGQADRFLDDAWSCAPMVLSGIADPATTVKVLDSYVRSLLASREKHSRSRLKAWLEAAR